MNRRKGLIGIAALAFVLAAGGARAQELQLKEADIRKLIPVLRAAAAGLGAAQAMSDRQDAARKSFSGDPLEFFRGRAKLDLPQGVRYVPSRRPGSLSGGQRTRPSPQARRGRFQERIQQDLSIPERLLGLH